MVANLLTLARPVLAGVLAVGVVLAGKGAPGPTTTAAVALIALAILEELTDILDGVAARRFGAAGELGAILDPLADSIARLTIYFAMALVGWIFLAVPLTMAGRDIIVAYTRVANVLTGRKASARFSGKLKAVIQGGGIVVVVLLAWLAAHGGQAAEMPVLRQVGPGGVSTLRTAVAGILIWVTVWSLTDYVRGAWPALRQIKRRQ